jgi:hypothetical protein
MATNTGSVALDAAAPLSFARPPVGPQVLRIDLKVLRPFRSRIHQTRNGFVA